MINYSRHSFCGHCGIKKPKYKIRCDVCGNILRKKSRHGIRSATREMEIKRY